MPGAAFPASHASEGEQRGVIGEAISLVSTAQTGSLHRTSGGEGYALAHRNASSKLDDNTPGDNGIAPGMSELIRTLIPVTAGLHESAHGRRRRSRKQDTTLALARVKAQSKNLL